MATCESPLIRQLRELMEENECVMSPMEVASVIISAGSIQILKEWGNSEYSRILIERAISVALALHEEGKTIFEKWENME